MQLLKMSDHIFMSFKMTHKSKTKMVLKAIDPPRRGPVSQVKVILRQESDPIFNYDWLG